MSRISHRDTQKLRDISQALGIIRPGEGSALDSLAEPIRELAATQSAVAYRLAARGNGIRLASYHGRAPNGLERLAPVLDQVLSRQPVDVLLYNPIRPAPKERNRVVDLTLIDRDATPERQAYLDTVRSTFGNDNQLRVLICDGPMFLAWFGFLQPEPYDRPQRALLGRLIGPLQKRLVAERLLGEAAGMKAALEAAFEAITAPAFLLAENGSVRHANAAGLAQLDADSTVTAVLRECALRPATAGPLRVTPICSPGTPMQYLVVSRAQADARAQDMIAGAAHAWRLTRRQTEVLKLLVDGHANTGICAHLGIAERTVEDHLRLMFEKSGVGGRTDLVAKVLSGRVR